MPLISYVKTATNKQLFISESHNDSNRCTPYRGNLIHMTRTLPIPVHVCHSYTYCMWSPYVVSFHADSIELDRFTAPNSTYQPRWVAHGTRLSFSLKHNHWSSALKPNICWRTSYIGLLGPYHKHVISTFNTCSWGPTHWSLTEIGRGYNLGGAGLPHHTPWLSQPTVLCFPPKGPAWSLD
jgi:hypothetical protein